MSHDEGQQLVSQTTAKAITTISTARRRKTPRGDPPTRGSRGAGWPGEEVNASGEESAVRPLRRGIDGKRKAGLAEKFWSEDLKLDRYEVQKWSE